MAYWGELYLRSTAPLLSAETTAKEAAYLARAFSQGAGPLLDVGCGHGRHAAALNAGALEGRVVGLERDLFSLQQRTRGFAAVRGDFRALPFCSGAFRGVYAWYSTLFIHDDATHFGTLKELSRCVRAGGRLVLHTVPFERLEAQPEAAYEGTLPDGSTVREHSRFDRQTGFDHGERQLTFPDGRVLSGAYAIRYYRLPELQSLLRAAGFTLTGAHGDLDGAPLSTNSPDLIVQADKTHA